MSYPGMRDLGPAHRLNVAIRTFAWDHSNFDAVPPTANQVGPSRVGTLYDLPVLLLEKQCGTRPCLQYHNILM